MALPTAKEAMDYMGLDFQDDAMVQANVARALRTATQLFYGAVGDDIEQYMPGDPRTKELILIYTDDLYTDRGVSAKVSNATRRLVADMEMQLRFELRLAREAAGGGSV